MTQATKRALPKLEYDTPVVFQEGDVILFARIENDDSPPNPCEDWDGVGKIYSGNRRHMNYKSLEECAGILEEDQDAVALSYFEHGNCLWSVANGGPPRGTEGDFMWDGVHFAGIWIPDAEVRKSYTGQDGKSRREWMIEQAASACETYTQWCNGDVYFYNVRAYRVRLDGQGVVYDALSDYRRDEPLAEDAVGGLFGWEDAEREATSAMEYVLARAEKEVA